MDRQKGLRFVGRNDQPFKNRYLMLHCDVVHGFMIPTSIVVVILVRPLDLVSQSLQCRANVRGAIGSGRDYGGFSVVRLPRVRVTRQTSSRGARMTTLLHRIELLAQHFIQGL